MSDVAIRIENLKKQYMLGAIGGQTLRAELQSRWARKRGKEDPNLKIGQDYANYGDSFYALKGINLEVKKGEALGIIGGNGAGKSTLLKILSRVTAPTEGDIWIDGRIASMLEVGTGFHPELTGRENIYMNGAILGMTKKEVDAKIESIIDFSECRQFIDTPVKRYSSGMYVKLAFAVASHLDAEIIIMDEVLAVGDMKFQKKCLNRMGRAAKEEGKTVLYVSHNMSTIRSLCSRCVVLDKGNVIFEGGVEEAIQVYMDQAGGELLTHYNIENDRRPHSLYGKTAKIKEISILGKEAASFVSNELMHFKVNWSVYKPAKSILIDITISYIDGTIIGYTECRDMLKDYDVGDYETYLEFDPSELADGNYSACFHISTINDNNELDDLDETRLVYFAISDDENKTVWQRNYFGSIRLNPLISINNSEVF